MPTFAFLYTPAIVTYHLRCVQNAHLPLLLLEIHSFGTILDARLLSMLCRSTSELLRTL